MSKNQDLQSPTSPLPLWESFSQLPSLPGVYWWLDENKKILYVGKAKDLKNRLFSYRQTNELSPRIREMVEQARFIQWQILRSELEALLVEAQLINAYQPPFNVLLKDDKSPLYVVLTKETWPRVMRFRRRDLMKKKIKGKVFGPFPSSYKITEVLKLIRPIFPWCNAPRRKVIQRCFENHLNLCPGVCTGEISEIDYQKNIDELGLFLSGKTKSVTNLIKKEMSMLVQAEKFEKAAILRDKLKLIAEVTSDTVKLRQDFFLPNLSQERSENSLVQLRQILSENQNLPREAKLNRIEGYDVSNTSGKLAVVSMVVFTNGLPDNPAYRSFNIKTLDTPNDFAMMAEALSRRAAHQGDWPTPDLLLIDGGRGQVRAVLKVLKDTSWANISVIGLAKNPDRLVMPTQTDSQDANWQTLSLTGDNLALQLLQQIRDEAHRFGKKKHVARRDKATLGELMVRD